MIDDGDLPRRCIIRFREFASFKQLLADGGEVSRAHTVPQHLARTVDAGHPLSGFDHELVPMCRERGVEREAGAAHAAQAFQPILQFAVEHVQMLVTIHRQGLLHAQGDAVLCSEPEVLPLDIEQASG